jgi:hypothetical protein
VLFDTTDGFDHHGGVTESYAGCVERRFREHGLF